MNDPAIIIEETVQIDGRTLIITTFDNGEVVMVESEES
jgi:hypothetical protein